MLKLFVTLHACYLNMIFDLIQESNSTPISHKCTSNVHLIFLNVLKSVFTKFIVYLEDIWWI